MNAVFCQMAADTMPRVVCWSVTGGINQSPQTQHTGLCEMSPVWSHRAGCREPAAMWPAITPDWDNLIT